MEKTIFILREVAWNFNDDWYSYVGANEVYKKFATYEEAYQEKMRLEISQFKNRYDCRMEIIEKLAQEGLTYETYTMKKMGIDHFSHIKELTGIDYKGLLESDLLKDFEFKVFIGWQSVIHFCSLMSQTSQDKILNNLLRDIESYPNEIGRCFGLLITGKEDFCDMYEYSKQHFNLDIEAILHSPFLTQNEASKNILDKHGFFIDCSADFYFDDLFRIMVLSSEEHIKTMLQVLKFDFYEIAEVRENDCLYKLYTNENFKDFNFYDYYDAFRKNPIEMGNEVRYVRGEEIPTFYYDNLQEVQNLLLSRTCDELTYEGEPKNYLKGSLSDLSEAPEILKSYMESYADYFVYDAENKILAVNYLHDGQTMQEVMRGFVALLRPEKVPFIIKPFPISDIPEKYIEVERKQEEERQRVEARRQENSSDLLSDNSDLPF